jgi:hypothetical protein
LPAIEAMFMTLAPTFLQHRRQCCAGAIEGSGEIDRECRCQSSSVVLTSVAALAMPALLTRMSASPSSSNIRVTLSDRDVTDERDALVADLMRDLFDSVRRSRGDGDALPSRAKASAIARPMPRRRRLSVLFYQVARLTISVR